VGQTVGGLPWPEPTDPLMAGSAAIRALAEAIDARPYYAAERLANFQAGSAGGADFTVGLDVSLWERIESNFAQTIPGTAAGFLVPRAGLYRLFASMTIYGAISGALAGCGIVATPSGKNVRYQRSVSGAAQARQTFQAGAIVRLDAGDTLVMVLWQNSGNPQQIGGSSGGAQWGTRFSAEWIAS
jgi:hypothetical protein